MQFSDFIVADRKYRIYEDGTYYSLTSTMKGDGFIQADTADLMAMILNIIKSGDTRLRNLVINGPVNTADRFAYDKDPKTGKKMVKVVPYDGSPLILTTRITRELYERLRGPEYSLEQSEMYEFDKPLKHEQVISPHPVWLNLATENMHLLEEFAQFVYKEMKQRLNQDKAMGIYPSHHNIDFTEVRPLRILKLRDGFKVEGYRRFDSNARIIGYAR